MHNLIALTGLPLEVTSVCRALKSALTALQLDPQSYYANAEFTIGGDIELPDDTSAKITSEGLLGGNYVSLSLVAAKTYCQRG